MTRCSSKHPAGMAYLGGFGVQNVHGVPAPGDPENRGVVKVLTELLGIQGGAGNQQLQVGSEPGDVFHQAKQDVSVQRTLVSLIHHHDRI